MIGCTGRVLHRIAGGNTILSAQIQSNSVTPQGRSKTAIALTAAYVLLSLAAALLPLLAKEGESLAGVYLVLVALPWSIMLGRLTARFGIDSIVFNYVFLLFGIFVNALVLYWTVSILTRRLSAKTGTQLGKF